LRSLVITTLPPVFTTPSLLITTPSLLITTLPPVFTTPSL
jgi:hypothetical protein